jgi:uncharacterized membrane protein YhaH (DUF805 family)
MHWYIDVLKKYADFTGRARRTEFWMFALFNFIVSLVLGIIDVVVGTTANGVGILQLLYSLAVLIPGLAVSARRLHDTGRSGWWLLLGLVPCIGAIVLLVFCVQDSQPASNQYGPNPKAVAL